MHPSPQSCLKPLRTRCARLWLLIIWIVSSHGLGPPLMAAAAQATGEHMLKLCSTHHGEMQVVLGHQKAACLRATATIPEGMSADASMLPGKPDHIIQLHSVEDTSPQARRQLYQQPALPLPLSIFAFDPCRKLFSSPSLSERRSQGYEPAWSAGLQVKTSWTVILC